MALSVVSIALTAASYTPVCPTISGLAKLFIINGKFPLLISSATFSATSIADISGLRSYVATFGESIKSRCSSSNCFSTPPLKKKVTCAYFSVSNINEYILS